MLLNVLHSRVYELEVNDQVMVSYWGLNVCLEKVEQNVCNKVLLLRLCRLLLKGSAGMVL